MPDFFPLQLLLATFTGWVNRASIGPEINQRVRSDSLPHREK